MFTAHFKSDEIISISFETKSMNEIKKIKNLVRSARHFLFTDIHVNIMYFDVTTCAFYSCFFFLFDTLFFPLTLFEYRVIFFARRRSRPQLESFRNPIKNDFIFHHLNRSPTIGLFAERFITAYACIAAFLVRWSFSFFLRVRHYCTIVITILNAARYIYSRIG